MGYIGLLIALLIVGILVTLQSGRGMFAPTKSEQARSTVDLDQAPAISKVRREGRHLDDDGADLRLEHLASVTVTGRVVSRHVHDEGPAPVDLGIGWAGMSSDKIDRVVTFESGPGESFSADPKPGAYEHEVVDQQSANIHAVPATSNLGRALRRVEVGDEVALTGTLVSLDGTVDGEAVSLRSSLDPADDKVMWVEELQVGDAVYR